MVKPVRRREVVRHFQAAFAVSERRACQASGFGRASHRYKSRRDPAPALRMRLKDLAASRVRYGYRRLHVLLQREGWVINHKRVYRLYSEEGLSIRTRSPKRRRSSRYRVGRATAEHANKVWSMDFVSDRLFDDRPFRILTILDCHTREALATCARTNFRAYQVAEELDRLVGLRGKPTSIRVDNGPESRRITPLSKPSTPACAANASTPPGSCPWPTLGCGSTPGGKTTTTTVRTRASRNLTPAEFADQLRTARELS